MKTISHVLIPTFLFLMIGCENSPIESAGMSDADLIDAIRSANKVDIPMNDMPSQSQSIIENDNEYDALGAKKASDLGYEVDLAGRGHRSGDRNEFYFNLEGRKLDPNDYGRDKDGWDRDKDDWDKDDKEGWECFKLIFPIIFVMPDGSSTTVISDDGQSWAELKSWYVANPNIEEKPSLQYPVVLSYKETNLTIENDEEMQEAYHRCSHKDDEKKEWDCFMLVYPLTFILPDNSVISMQDKGGWIELKSWYEVNPDMEELPTAPLMTSGTHQA